MSSARPGLRVIGAASGLPARPSVGLSLHRRAQVAAPVERLTALGGLRYAGLYL